MLAVASPAAAAPDSKAQIVPLGMSIANAPNPVLGADGRNHLAYEITMVNQTPGEVTVESVQARSGGRPIGARLQGESLAALLRVNSGGRRSFRAAVARSCSWMCGTRGTLRGPSG